MEECTAREWPGKDSFLSVIQLLYLAFSGVACVYGVTRYLGIPFNSMMAITSSATILGIYTLNRVSDIREDFFNDTGTSLFLWQERLFLFLGAGMLVVVLLFHVASGKLTLYYTVLIAVGVSYSFPVLPWIRNCRFEFVRIKQIPFVKSLTVAAFWGVSVFCVPIALSLTRVSEIPSSVYILLPALSLATFSNTLFSDIRDTTGDRLAGNITIPVLLGVRKAYMFVYAANTILVLLGLISWHSGCLQAKDALLVEFMGLYAFVYIGAHWSGKAAESVVEILSDSHFLVFGIGLALTTV